jgi:hypothetical protein
MKFAAYVAVEIVRIARVVKQKFAELGGFAKWIRLKFQKKNF